MRFTHESQVRPGVEIFYVHSFPTGLMESFIIKYVVTEDPKPSLTTSSLGSSSLFAKARRDYINLLTQATRISYDEPTDLWIENYQVIPWPAQSFSLCDAGINQSPKYNNHALFDNLIDAMQYVELALNNSQKSPISSEQPITVDPTSDYDRAMQGI